MVARRRGIGVGRGEAEPREEGDSDGAEGAHHEPPQVFVTVL